jgi:ribulose-bisphosphate carboxylase large chain
MRVLKYLDFVDTEYQPPETDLICTFHIEPEGISIKEAAGGVAAESSIGTWTEITTTKPYVRDLAAYVFNIEGKLVKIAYPIELFEQKNMPNILSSIAGNVFGLKALKNLRLNDINLPPKLVQGFKGPQFGIKGIRELLKVWERPLVGTIIKPKLGLKTSDHAQVAYEAWTGGCDIVKDDENLSSQRFNPFEDRIVKTLESRDKAEAMRERAEYVLDHGGEYVMVDILTCGFSSLQTLRDQGFKLVIHAHRAGHAAFTKNAKHGIAMRVIAKVARIIGVDQLHVGTVVGKMSETREEVLENINALRAGMSRLKPVMPVASGGLHPKLVPPLIETFGKDFIIQAGGGIHGHPRGTKAGATAVRQAVNAVLEGKTLKEFAETHKELRAALKHWLD